MNQILSRTLSVLCVAVVAVALASPSWAGDAKDAKKKGLMLFEGEITGVDAGAKTVTVKKKDDSKTFLANEATKIYAKGSKEATDLGKLKVGDKVSIEYHDEDGKHVANRIAEKGSNPDKIEHKADKKDK